VMKSLEAHGCKVSVELEADRCQKLADSLRP
jgi:hypothetical protein